MNRAFKPNPTRHADRQSDSETPDSDQALSDSSILDADWLRSFPQCAHYTDKRAAEVIMALSIFGALLIDISFFAHQVEVPLPQEYNALKPTTPTRLIPLKPKKKAA